MKKLFAQKNLFLLSLVITFTTVSKEQPSQTTATCGNFSYSQPCNSSGDNKVSSNQSGFFSSSSNQTNFPCSQQLSYTQEQLNDLVFLTFLKKQIGESKFAQFMHECHINNYGCSAQHLNEIIEYYSFEELERLIIHDQRLTKEQALNTWQWFCNQRFWHSKKKNDGHDHIVQKYDQKEKAKLKDQEKEKALKQELQKLEKQQRDKQELLERQKKEEKDKSAKQAEQHKVLRLRTQKEFIQAQLVQCGLNPEQCIYLPQDFKLLEDQYKYLDQFCKEKSKTNIVRTIYNDCGSPVQARRRRDDGISGSLRSREGGNLCAELSQSCYNSQIWSERLNALQKTKEQNFSQSFQETTLSPQACGYLLASDLQPNHYQSCYGTAFQQQLHLEICSSFEMIAQTQQNFLISSSSGLTRGSINNTSSSSFLHAATACTDAAHWSNQFESMPITMHLIDLGKACYQVGEWTLQNGPIYAQAMADGVVDSVWDFAHMVTHPAELVQNLSLAAWFVLDSMALADQDSIGATLPIAHAQLQERINTVSVAAVALQGSVINATGPERVKMATKFTADCIFMHKATQAVGAVAGILPTQAKIMRTAEYASEIVGCEPAFASATESISQATQELETFMQKSVAQELAPVAESLEKAGIVSAEIRIATRSITEIAAEIEKLGGKILLRDSELCQEAKILVKQFVKDTNCLIERKLHQQLASKWLSQNGMKTRVNMDIDHILNYSCEFLQNELLGQLEVKFKGGHLAGSSESLASTGVVKVINKNTLANGCIEYKLQDVLTGNSFTKTEFPAHWDYKKITESCWEVYENPAIADYIEQAPKAIREGVTSDGFKMSIVLKTSKQNFQTTLAQNTVNIITALPFTKKI